MKKAQLEYQIEVMEKRIKGLESRGEDASYEKKLVKSWKRELKKYGNSNKRTNNMREMRS